MLWLIKMVVVANRVGGEPPAPSSIFILCGPSDERVQLVHVRATYCRPAAVSFQWRQLLPLPACNGARQLLGDAIIVLVHAQR